jgi:uncharacterized protein (DUF849 family)
MTTVLTCAITGNLTRPDQTPYLPITPEQIADECLAAAEEGAAAVHIHVRDPQTGQPSMELELYRDVVDRVRKGRPDLLINLTTGPGGRYVPSADNPRVAAEGTTLLPPLQRVEHIRALRPDICSLDLNTMNSGSQVVMNTPATVRTMAKVIREAGVMPELEIFDSGDIHLARDLIADGSLKGPGVWTFVTGVKYAFNASPETLAYARSLLPAGAVWSAFGVGRHEFPMLAQAWLLGGHVRVGLEDNIYLSKGVLAKSNAELVRKARLMVEDLGGELASTAQARAAFGLT